MLKQTTTLSLATLTTAALIGSANAATISYIGVDTTTGADWRTASTAKASAFDPDGDNIYGSDGYYMTYGPSDLTVGDNVLGSNGTGPLASSNVYSDLPTYISSVVTAGPFFVNNSYATFDDPTGGSDVFGGLLYNAGDKFTFSVSQNTEFVLTVLVGEGNSAAPSGITINQTSGTGAGTATISNFANTDNGSGEYVFFNISALSGDSFAVNIAANSSQGITGLGFEVVPEPGSLALLGLGGLCVLRRRRD